MRNQAVLVLALALGSGYNLNLYSKLGAKDSIPAVNSQNQEGKKCCQVGKYFGENCFTNISVKSMSRIRSIRIQMYEPYKEYMDSKV